MYNKSALHLRNEGVGVVNSQFKLIALTTSSQPNVVSIWFFSSWKHRKQSKRQVMGSTKSESI